MNKLLTFGLLIQLFPGLVMAGDVDGQVSWSQRIELTTGVSGTIEKVKVTVGDRVTASESLLILDQELFKAALSRAQAKHKDASYKLKEAEREWDRARELYERTVLSDRDLQLAENALVAAQADMATAAAALTHAKHDFHDSVIRAPMNAVVIERQAEPGQTVVNRLQVTPLITVAATDSYLAQAAVSAEVASTLKKGVSVPVTVSGKRYPGTVYSVGFEPVGQDKAYPVSIQFSTATTTLRAGQSATIHLP